MPGPDYVEEKVKCKEFLEGYNGAISDDEEGDDVGVRPKKYMKLLQKVANRRENTVEIKLDDVADYIEDDLMANIQKNTRRYAMLFAEAIDELLPRPTEDGGEESVFDVLMRQRRRADGAEEGQEPAAPDPANQLPPEMRRTYEVRIIPQTKMKAMAIREVKAADIGHLVTIKGIITRCTDVKPLMSVATYTCDECGFEIYQEVTARQFMPLHECPSIRCRSNNARGQLQLQTRGSKFVKFQEARIQEMSEQVPKGHIPRTMTIHIRGELTRKVGPGDVVSVSGIFLPVPYTGFRAMRAGLVADTFLEATSIRQMKKRYQEYQLDAETQAEVETLAEEGDVYARLSRSIAPEIYGHEDVKKALLLLLVGGTTKQLKDGMKIRGDLHVCLMGDPGVAKSQLLKQICVVAPRAVYTTGKGSSGVGLTAAVTRDTVTNEMVLEGGALVLADMGICCIDEFDKMEESDRTAIHEVMEQQTVSIAKAGITTTLNARTSVLAAANPAWGRYDLRRSPAENINLPPALLSRFDLLWLILDRADSEADLRLAQHVLHVHQNNKAPDLEFNPLSAHVLRAYISLARQYEPVIPRELTEYIAGAYSTLRQEEAASEAPTTYTTARTLLSTIRLSQALARLRFSRAVQQSDVDEALRLMQMSKMSLQDDETRRSGLDPISDVYTILRDEAKKKDTIHIQYTDAVNWITRKGYNQQQLDECLEEYAALNVWQVHPTTKDVHFTDTD